MMEMLSPIVSRIDPDAIHGHVCNSNKVYHQILSHQLIVQMLMISRWKVMNPLILREVMILAPNKIIVSYDKY